LRGVGISPRGVAEGTINRISAVTVTVLLPFPDAAGFA
jgi:hypothetical protein